ncbi:MAG: GNAT family N-acetyltransferase [Pseudomonadota bacterium]
MDDDLTVRLVPQIPETGREDAARLFWQAFQGKLGKVMGPDAKAIAFLTRVLNPSFGIAALDVEGRVIGIAGFKTADGALVGGEMRDLFAVYGVFGGLWRGVTLSVLERETAPGTLLMDGIFVESRARGLGVGTQLLHAIKARAAELGLDHVRLDVIDSNPKARALYERQGFQAEGQSHLGPLSWIFGFKSATAMRVRVNGPKAQHSLPNPPGRSPA